MNAKVVTTPGRATRSPLARSHEDAAAFADFYADLSAKVLGFFLHRTRDGHVSLDLTAETFAKAFEKRADFRGDSDAQAAGWLWAIARNELGAHWRELSRRERAGPDDRRASDEDILRVEELTSAEASREQLKAGLQALGLEQRQAIGLHLVLELDYDEVGQRLGISNQLARTRVSRGLRSLRQLTDPCDELTA
jgi:RNA polymerase sigma-70 factor (ECF subfamily)